MKVPSDYKSKNVFGAHWGSNHGILNHWAGLEVTTGLNQDLGSAERETTAAKLEFIHVFIVCEHGCIAETWSE